MSRDELRCDLQQRGCFGVQQPGDIRGTFGDDSRRKRLLIHQDPAHRLRLALTDNQKQEVVRLVEQGSGGGQSPRSELVDPVGDVARVLVPEGLGAGE